MGAAFFTGMFTGIVIVFILCFFLSFAMKNAVFLVNCDDELTDRVRRIVAAHEA